MYLKGQLEKQKRKIVSKSNDYISKGRQTPPNPVIPRPRAFYLFQERGDGVPLNFCFVPLF